MMKKLLAAALFAVLALASVSPAFAGKVLCNPGAAATGPLAGTIGGGVGGSISAVPSQTLYTLSGSGCVYIKQQDEGYFRSLGFTDGTNLFFKTVTGVTANQTTSAGAPVTLPAGAALTAIYIQNTTANAVTGGINIGTAAAGAQVVSALTCGANCMVSVPSASILQPITSASGVPISTQLFINAASAFNSASLNVTYVYSLMYPY